MSGIQIKKEFKHLTTFLTGDPQQFLVVAGEYYCVRDGCEDCPYFNKGCESKEEKISSAIIPPARRAVGLEETPFLVLQLQEGKEFRLPQKDEENPNLVPLSLWNTPRDVYSLDERNLHFITSNLKHKFRVLKGQFRFYGTKEDFASSEYAKYFFVFNEYHPQHHVVAFDFSAIEPRGSAIAAKEKKWIQIYEGIPKVIVKWIEPQSPLKGNEEHIFIKDNKVFCILLGELDKVTFDQQCRKCKTPCIVKREYKKNIPGDFHGINAKAFFSSEPDWPVAKEDGSYTKEQKDIFDKYRGISKVCGLASVYGARAGTLAKNMGCSIEVAQKRLDNFFAELSEAKKYMLFTEQQVIKRGKVINFFGRVRDVSRWSKSSAPTERERKQDLGYAIRTGLNHPIQSSMAEILKISMIRIDEHIQEKNWSPLYGPVVPRTFAPYSYQNFICTMLLSIHDEEDFLIRTQDFDTVIPSVYQVLQVKDVVKSLGVDFSLEMDVEYDSTRSFTATTKYPSSRIFLLNSILSSKVCSAAPNMILLKIDDISTEILEKIKLATHNTKEEVFLGIQTDNALFVYPNKVSESFLQEITVKKYKAFFSG